MQLVVWNRLDQPFSSNSSGDVKSFDLGCHRPGKLKGASFGGDFTHYSSRKRLVSVDASAGEEQVSDNTISCIALESGNPATTGDQPQAKFGKTETRHCICDDQVAC